MIAAKASDSSRCDLQQPDHLAGARQGVGDEAAMGEFEHLPGPHRRVAQDLDARPCPEGVVLKQCDVDPWPAAVDRASEDDVRSSSVASWRKPAQRDVLGLKHLTRPNRDGGCQQCLRAAFLGVGSNNKLRQDG
jgi:hypothetical protein